MLCGVYCKPTEADNLLKIVHLIKNLYEIGYNDPNYIRSLKEGDKQRTRLV